MCGARGAHAQGQPFDERRLVHARTGTLADVRRAVAGVEPRGQGERLRAGTLTEDGLLGRMIAAQATGDALTEDEVEDCRWTPCFDCGVCPQLDLDIQIGPTGRKLIPVTIGAPPSYAAKE